jgi:dTMP kinase
MALIVAFEGIDGCGKSSTIRNVSSVLQAQRLLHAVVPYVPDNGIREAILHDEDLDKLSRALLYKVLARKAWRQVDRLRYETDIILMDRCDDSFLSYQGAGEQLMDSILRLNDEFENRQPDIVFLLDIDLDTSEQRIATRYEKQGGKKDILERKPRDFFERVRACYHRLMTHEPRLDVEGHDFHFYSRQKNHFPVRYTIDAAFNDEQQVLSEILKVLLPLLEIKKSDRLDQQHKHDTSAA